MKDKSNHEVKYNREHFKLKYCKTCKYVWERGYCRGSRARTIYKYKELSSYKLERKECLICERKNDANINSNTRAQRLETQYY